MKTKNVYIESYGCQMNVSDSEIVLSILAQENYLRTLKIEDAQLILLNTCSIRDKAEQTIRKRLLSLKHLKKKGKTVHIGILGCMAERLKEKLLVEEQTVDLVVGPDAYRSLPQLLRSLSNSDFNSVNTQLSLEETYADISPVRVNEGVTAFTTIMRGCDNMCSFCVVPFTRGRERSRSPESIVQEVQQLAANGYKEVTLLGQNVDSYLWFGGGPKKHFQRQSEMQKAAAINFAGLLELVSLSAPGMRIRFSTSNPQDMTEEVIQVIAKYPNICKYIHLPVQSGSDRILKLMHRGYTRKKYLELIRLIRSYIPNCGISHDIIAGFPTETDQDHQDTLSLMKEVKYDFGYMFKYSERPGTPAAKKLVDDIPEEVKLNRLQEIIALQQQHAHTINLSKVGTLQEVLVEGESKRSKNHWYGRTSEGTVIVFNKLQGTTIGSLVKVRAASASSATLMGQHWETSKKRLQTRVENLSHTS